MPEQAPDGSIIITPKEFYDGVKQDISGINSNISALREELSPLPQKVSKLEDRVDRLEKRIAYYAGAAAALGALAATFVPVVFK